MAITLALSTACSSSQAPAFRDVAHVDPIPTVAKLSAEREEIDFPLDAYTLSMQEKDRIEEANNAKMQACLGDSGHSVNLKPYARHRTYAAERPYGAWSISNAETNGYSLPDDFDGTQEFDLSTQSAEFNRAWDECLNTSLVSSNVSVSQGITTRLQREASILAAQDDGFQKPIDAWSECLEEKDLRLDKDSQFTVDLSSANGNEEKLVRIAIADATCKDSVSMVQRLADIEASYQTALIQQNEGDLKAYREELDSMMAEAENVILSGGRS